MDRGIQGVHSLANGLQASIQLTDIAAQLHFCAAAALRCTICLNSSAIGFVPFLDFPLEAQIAFLKSSLIFSSAGLAGFGIGMAVSLASDMSDPGVDARPHVGNAALPGAAGDWAWATWLQSLSDRPDAERRLYPSLTDSWLQWASACHALCRSLHSLPLGHEIGVWPVSLVFTVDGSSSRLSRLWDLLASNQEGGG